MEKKIKTLARIGLFFVLTFVFTITFAIGQQLVGIDPEKISLPQFGPGLAAIVMIIVYKRDDVKLNVSFMKISFLKYLGALGIPISVSAIQFLIYNQFISPLTAPTIDAASFALLLGGIMLGAFGEEVGWRGYAQNLLAKRLNGLAGFLIIGVLWGVWHVGNFQNGPLFMLFFVFSTIGYSAVMAWLLKGTNYNVLLATLFHFSVNAGFFMLRDAQSDIRLVALNGIFWLGAAVVVVLGDRNGFLPLRKDAQSSKIAKLATRLIYWR